MNWIEVRTETCQEYVEALEEGFLAAGALAVTMQDGADQPILEPDLGTMPIWDKTNLIALFEQDIDINEAVNLVEEVFKLYQPATPLPKLSIDILENEDWTRKWIENFQPLKCGERLWICPSWCEPPQPDAVNLLLDPGLAFAPEHTLQHFYALNG